MHTIGDKPNENVFSIADFIKRKNMTSGRCTTPIPPPVDEIPDLVRTETKYIIREKVVHKNIDINDKCLHKILESKDSPEGKLDRINFYLFMKAREDNEKSAAEAKIMKEAYEQAEKLNKREDE